MVVVRAALSARNTNTSQHNLSTSAPVRNAPSTQSGFEGFFVYLPKSLSPPQRARSRSRRQHLIFSAGTWRHILWQIDQRAFSALRAALPKCLLGGALRRCSLRVSTVVCHLPASSFIGYACRYGIAQPPSLVPCLWRQIPPGQ